MPFDNLSHFPDGSVPTQNEVTGHRLASSFYEQSVKLLGSLLRVAQVYKSALNLPDTGDRVTIGDKLSCDVFAVPDIPKPLKTIHRPIFRDHSHLGPLIAD